MASLPPGDFPGIRRRRDRGMETRRLALLAATKVSLSAVLVIGCGGQVQSAPASASEGDTGVADKADTNTPDTFAADTNVADTNAPDTIVAESSPPGDSSACASIVQSALADAGEPATSSDPAVQACCKEILPLWTWEANLGISYEAARACCQVLGGDKWWEIAAPACTPWGPPMPPSIDSKGESVGVLPARRPMNEVIA